MAGWLILTVAVLGALALHRRLPWIPLLYLGALIALPVLGWRVARSRSAARLLRWSTPALAIAAVLALCPVPWMKAGLEHPPGNAWQLDGRLAIDGVVVDPPGTWYWLTVGRPPIVAEVVRSWLSHDAARPTNMRSGRLSQRPAISEPAAAAVGLRRAGWVVELTMIVEVSEPLRDRLPAKAVLAMVNGVQVSTPVLWDRAMAGLDIINTITTATGESFAFTGAALPFGRVDVIEIPRDGLDAAVGGWLGRTLPGSWFRDLSLGSSHGLIVALVSYVHGSGEDLARSRTIAATGRIRSDGTIGTIGGLRAKAAAARDVGADLLLIPADQADMLAGFDAGSMLLVPVSTLDEAIEALRRASP